jgi:hypothetical protein
LTAQRGKENKLYKYDQEVNIDATAVLGNVLSLNSEVAKSPYGFGYRRHYENSSLRISGNTLSSKTNTFEFNGVEFLERTIIENQHSLRVGLEKGFEIANNFRMLYGFDILAGYSGVDSRFESSFNRNEVDYTFGLGPALRIEYRISDRFFLMTESTFYGTVIYNVDTFKLGSDPTQRTTGTEYNVNMALPTAIIFAVSF